MKLPKNGKDNDQPGSDDFLDADDGSGMDLEDSHQGEQLDGNLESSPDDEKDKLSSSVLDVDTNNIDDGMIVQEAFNQNLGSFMPDIMFEQMVKDFKNAKKLYGETIIRELSGYDPRFVEKNVKIPEFQRELKKRLKDSAEQLVEKGITTSTGIFTKEALLTAALYLIDEEYQEQKNQSSSLGEHVHFANDMFGEKSFVRPFLKGDHYRDIAMKHTIKQAIRRGRTSIDPADLQTFERESRQQVNVVYALDTSGSMKGEKLKLAKKAGVALAHKAIRDNNQVGLVLFGSDVEKKVHLTKELFAFVEPLTKITPGAETDIGLAIKESTKLLERAKGIKHIIILTDGLHTTSDDPKKAVLEEVGKAQSQEITISIVGINLDELGLDLAQAIVDMSNGRLHGVAESTDVGGIVIADYEKLI